MLQQLCPLETKLMSERKLRLQELFIEAPLYAILDTSIRPELPCPIILESLLNAGVKVIQYRHKGKFGRAQWEECSALARRTHEFSGRFFVNDRADAAKLCEADGVHLGQQDLPPEKARLFLGEDMEIGYSTHGLEQAMEQAREQAMKQAQRARRAPVG